MQTAATLLRQLSILRLAPHAVVLVTLGLFATQDIIHILDGLFTPQDEGILLVYPDLILRGFVPYRDFAALYPPADFYILAGIFRIFGESVSVERSLGAVYLWLIILAVFLIGSRVNRPTAAFAAITASAYTSSFVFLAAYTHFGAYACMLFALFLASRDCSGPSTIAKHSLLLAGAVAGTTLWFKQDLGAVAIVATFVTINPRDPLRIRPFLAGLAIPAIALIGFSIVIGPAEVFDSLILDPMRSAPGRYLPIHANWELGVIAACVTLQCVTAVRVGSSSRVQYQLIWLARGMAALSLGFSVSLLHRTEPGDIAYYGFLVVSLTIVSLSILMLHMGLGPRRELSVTAVAFVAGLVPVGIVHFNPKPYIENAHQDWVFSGGRRAPIFAVGNSKSTDLQRLLDELNRQSQPGQGLFIGTADLRFAIYNDTVVYFLLPQLRPVSRYLEMNPGCANRHGSGLTKEISNADWVILTTRYDHWTEPNASAVAGPAEPNDVVRNNFCLRSRYGEWKLLYHCGAAEHVNAHGS
jgi:hypothetical protein